MEAHLRSLLARAHHGWSAAQKHLGKLSLSADIIADVTITK